MPLEKVRDNQWWYSRSVYREQVDNAACVTLKIDGQCCRLIHSDPGRDGRPTHSFKFVDKADRDRWIRLRGQEVDIEVVEYTELIADLSNSEYPRYGSEQRTTERLVRRESTPTLFDAYVFVDWSAASRPKTGKDSVWIAEGRYVSDGSLAVERPTNPSTRSKAAMDVQAKLRDYVHNFKRVLVGFDFPYGYPAGWNTAVGVTDSEWRALWATLEKCIEDDKQNKNNRFDIADRLNKAVAHTAGPYWGRPAALAANCPNVPSHKPKSLANDIPEFREVERDLRRNGKLPSSVWQLLGNGAVGSQALVGIPVLHRLRTDDQFRDCSQIWPFETGWDCPVAPRPFVLHAEIWPGAIEVNQNLCTIRDAAQVLSYVYWAAQMDIDGNLAAFFNPHSVMPSYGVQDCEGWVLGWKA